MDKLKMACKKACDEFGTLQGEAAMKYRLPELVKQCLIAGFHLHEVQAVFQLAEQGKLKG